MNKRSEQNKKVKGKAGAGIVSLGNRVRRPQLYVIAWLDILSDATWHDGNPSTANPARCVTCGWLVHECDQKLVLADSKSKETNDDDGWGGLTVIPAAVVVDRFRVSAKSPDAFMA